MSTTDHTFCIHHILENFKNAYDLGMREALYNIQIQFGMSTKSVWLTKMSK